MSTVSTTINEIIVTGRAERQLIDKAAKLWQRISRWTHSSDVEFEDGKTAEQKVGNINGITSVFGNRDDIAASISSVNSVKEELEYRIGGFRIYKGEDGNIYIIDENAGADSVPKKLGDVDPEILCNNENIYVFQEDVSHVYVWTTAYQHENDPAHITIKLSNQNQNNNIFVSKPSWKDEESGFIATRLTYSVVSTNSSGGALFTLFYLFENVPSGTILNQKCIVVK